MRGRRPPTRRSRPRREARLKRLRCRRPRRRSSRARDQRGVVAVPESAQSEDAQLIALRALSHKERTVSEMLELLEGRGVERTERERVVGELIEIGTLDDRHYAEQFAADKRSLALWGRDRIQRTLIERGIDSSIATAAVDESIPRSIR